jgi:methionyl-tRNA formyltransferase
VRTVFLGTSDFAVAILERLAASPHRPTLVVTRPDRPRGRGRKLSPPPAAEAARVLGIDVDQPESVNSPEALERIDAARAEAVIVCAYGAIVKEPLLSRYPMLNVHPSLLPRWRGAAPIERAIMAGDDRTGVSIMRLTEGLDSGPVGLRRDEPIHPDDTYGSLAGRLRVIGGDLLVAALDHPPEFTEQDDAQATYAEKIEAADRLLDPSRAPIELEWTVRALTPHIGARLRRPDGELLGVRRAIAAIDEAQPGELVATDDGRLVFGATGGSLELLEVQPPGKKPMDAADYLRGHRVA